MTSSISWDPRSYAQNARFVSDLGEPLIELLKPKAGERILDLGCGDGALTEKIAAAGCAVVGIDSSLAQLRAARRRGLRVVLMDGQRLGLRRRFDAVFSNAALHWMKRPERVVEGVAHSLMPGRRFVGEFGGKGNVETIRAALHTSLRQRGMDPWEVDPWYYPSVAEYSGLLDRFGFAVEYMELMPRPTTLPGDLAAWLEIFAQPFLKAVGEEERAAFLAEISQRLKPALQKPDGSWRADYVRLRFKAIRR